MGICTSCNSVVVSTAKLIFHDGGLQEFDYPVKASYILQKNSNSKFFICNSDEMEFGDVVYAIKDDEELVPGQLYFALPLDWLNQPLKAEEMAALAVKASGALMKSSDRIGKGKNSVAPLNFLAAEPPRRKKAAAGCGGRRRRSRKFEAVLSVIPE